jgi:hypothetical protein
VARRITRPRDRNAYELWKALISEDSERPEGGTSTPKKTKPENGKKEISGA